MNFNGTPTDLILQIEDDGCGMPEIQDQSDGNGPEVDGHTGQASSVAHSTWNVRQAAGRGLSVVCHANRTITKVSITRSMTTMSSEQHSTNHVFLVDDHPLVCQGIAAVLSQAGFVICGKAGNSTETLEHPQLVSANLAIVDLALGEEDGLKLIPTLRAQGILVLVYTMYEEPSRVTGALAAGATGYVIQT